MARIDCYASSSFGLEGIVSRELKELGIEDIRVQDARVYFKATKEATNLPSVSISI